MEELDIREIFNMFWEKKLRIILIVIFFAIIGVVYSLKFVTPLYTSSTTLVLVQASETSGDNNSITTTDLTLNSKLVSTYSELIKSKTILRQVISNLEIETSEEEIRKEVSVNAKSNTEVIEITVKNEDAMDAYKIANEIAKVFVKEVTKIYNINNVCILDEAEVAEGPSNINHIRDVVIFMFIGMVIACGYVIIENMLNNTVKSTEDIEKKLQVPVLASIALYNFDNKKGGRNDG